MDYTSLRNFGLEHIRAIGSAHWTDFNVHDPGVTMLEAVSLAVADLSYRSSSAMADLLTRRGQNGPQAEGAMFPAGEIFLHAPTTFGDYRKLILENLPGVRNVTFRTRQREVRRPHVAGKLEEGITGVRGFYDVFLELEDEDVLLRDELARQVIAGGEPPLDDEAWRSSYRSLYRDAARRLLLEERNLAEMPSEITVLEPIAVGLWAEVEILSDFDPLRIIQDIHDTLYGYVCPTIEFHQIEELIARGRHAWGIIGSRAPRLGFIDPEELSGFSRRTDLHVSDIIRLISSLPGVRSVRNARLIVPQRWQSEVEADEWSLHMVGPYTFSFTPLFQRSGTCDRSLFSNRIVLRKNRLSFLPPSGEDGMRALPVSHVRQPLSPGFRTSPAMPGGTYRQTDRYFSFQNLLPGNYRMGTDTLPESASPLRKAERLQLKAYLTFFDQTLSDCLAQIDRFLDLMSLEADSGQGTPATYFHRRLTDADIVDVSKVLAGYPEYAIPDEDPKADLERKNGVLNYLLGLFADRFADYAALRFVQGAGVGSGQLSQFSLRENVEDKKRYLRDYPSVSARRSSAPDLGLGFPLGGAERRILRKIGVNDPESRLRIADTDFFGLHIIEHTLLAPYTGEGRFLEISQQEDSALLSQDPYSFHVTVAMPGWTSLALDLSFREYVENVIREELPAHLMVKICWISRESMRNLELALDIMSRFLRGNGFHPSDRTWAVSYDIHANEIVSALSGFCNIYRGAVLSGDEVENYTDEEVSRLDCTFIEGPDGKDGTAIGQAGMQVVFDSPWTEECRPSAPSSSPVRPSHPVHPSSAHPSSAHPSSAHPAAGHPVTQADPCGSSEAGSGGSVEMDHKSTFSFPGSNLLLDDEAQSPPSGPQDRETDPSQEGQGGQETVPVEGTEHLDGSDQGEMTGQDEQSEADRDSKAQETSPGALGSSTSVMEAAASEAGEDPSGNGQPVAEHESGCGDSGSGASDGGRTEPEAAAPNTVEDTSMDGQPAAQQESCCCDSGSGASDGGRTEPETAAPNTVEDTSMDGQPAAEPESCCGDSLPDTLEGGKTDPEASTSSSISSAAAADGFSFPGDDLLLDGPGADVTASKDGSEDSASGKTSVKSSGKATG